MKKFALLMVISVLFAACQKLEVKPEKVYNVKHAQGVTQAKDIAIYQQAVAMLEKAEAARLLNSDAAPSKGIDYNADVKLRLFSNWHNIGNQTYPEMIVDSGVATVASFCCIIEAGQGLTFTSLQIDNIPTFFDWSDYMVVWKVQPDYIGFAAISLTPIQINAVDMQRLKLFWIGYTGAGTVTWNGANGMIGISEDGYNDYSYTLINGSII